MSVATVNANLPGLAVETGISLFTELAQRLELPHTLGDGHLSFRMSSGEISLATRAGRLAISLRAENAHRLYALQQVVHSRLDQLDPVPELVWDRVNEGALPPNLSIATVQSVTALSPNYARVRVTGPDIARFASGGLHFRLLVPQNAAAPKWPRIAPDGRTVWPEGEDSLHRPVYTVRAIDPVAGWLDIDVFLHDGGRITAWTKRAQPGQHIGLMGPSGSDLPVAGWMALFADETALPAAARILANLPPMTTGQVYITVTNPADRQPLICPPLMSVHWLKRGSSDTLLARLTALKIPENDRYIWFSAEKAEADAARTYVRETLGLGRAGSNISAYWSAGQP